MTKIIINGTTEVLVIGDQSAEDVVRGHGYDPDSDDWVVDDSGAELSEAINNASNLRELKSVLDPKSTNSPGTEPGRNDS